MAKKQEPEIKQGLPGWMATYGDLVTLLLCFFVLLFAMSSIDVTKFKAAISSFSEQIDILDGGIALTGQELITNGIDQLESVDRFLDKNVSPDQENYDGKPTSTVTKAIAKDIMEELKQAGIDSKVKVSYSDNYVKLSLSGEVLFDSGSAKIKDESMHIIGKIGSIITENGYNQYLVQVEGHTDNIPMNTNQYPNNWYLSSARAINVGLELMNKYPFEPELLACMGYGEFRPIADNSTREGRSINRRVEVKIMVEREEILVEEIIE